MLLRAGTLLGRRSVLELGVLIPARHVLLLVGVLRTATVVSVKFHSNGIIIMVNSRVVIVSPAPGPPRESKMAERGCMCGYVLYVCLCMCSVCKMAAKARVVIIARYTPAPSTSNEGRNRPGQAARSSEAKQSWGVLLV